MGGMNQEMINAALRDQIDTLEKRLDQLQGQLAYLKYAVCGAVLGVLIFRK